MADSSLTQGLQDTAPERTPESFLSGIRTKWPAYQDVPDDTLIEKFATKYPAYSDIAATHFQSKGNNEMAQKFATQLTPEESAYYSNEPQNNAIQKSMQIDTDSEKYGAIKPLNNYGGMLDPFAYKDNGEQAIARRNSLFPYRTPLDDLMQEHPGQSEVQRPVQSALKLLAGTQAAAESAATGQGMKAATEAFKNPSTFNSHDLEINAIKDAGVKNPTAQKVLGHILGFALDTAPAIIGEGAGLGVAKYSRAQGVALDAFKESLANEFKIAGMPEDMATQKAAETASKYFNNSGVMDRTPWRINKFTEQIENNEGALGKIFKSKMDEARNTFTGTDVPEPPVNPPMTQLQSPEAETPTQVPTAVPQAESKPSGILSNQSGAINPSAIASVPGAVVSNVQSYLKSTSNITQASGDVEHDFNVNKGNDRADENEALKTLKSLDKVLSPQDETTLHHYSDAIDAGIKPPALNPNQAAIYQHAVIPIQNQNNQIIAVINKSPYAQLADMSSAPIKTPHVVMSKGGWVDKLHNIAESGASSGSSLSKSSPSLKKRTMYALTDEQGNRSVANIEHGQVAKIENGVRTELGPFDLQKNIDLLKQEISPVQDKIASLKKTISDIKSIRTKPNLPESRINVLNRRIADVGTDLSSAYGKFDIGGSIDRRLRARLDRAFLELKAYSRVLPSEDTVLRDRRLATLDSKIAKFEALINRTIGKYDVSKLENKVFVDKSGKKYSVGPVTTKEIETHTKLKYSDKLLANLLQTNLQLKKNLRAIKLLDSTLNTLKSKGMALPKESGNAPKGFRESQLIRGYYFPDKVADVLDSHFFLAKNESASVEKVLGSATNILLRTMFLDPLTSTFHIANMGANLAASRGVQTWVPFTGRYLTSKSVTSRAFTEVATLGPLYQKLLRMGVPLEYSGTQDPFISQVAKRFGMEAYKNPTLLNQLAKEFGMPAADLANGLWNASTRIMLFYQDMTVMERIMEHMSDGLTEKQAIDETLRRLPVNPIPVHVLGSRMLSQLLSSRALFIFARYGYGLKTGIGNIVKDLYNWGKVNVTKQPEAIRKEADFRARGAIGLAVGIIAIYEITKNAKKAAEKITGNPNSEMRSPGYASLIRTAEELKEGKKTKAEVASSLFIPSASSRLISEIAFNRNFLTGKKVYREESFVEDMGKLFGQEMTPNEVKVMQGKKSMREFLASFIEITSPKMGPYERQLFSQIFENRDTAKKEITDLLINGERQKASDLLRNYNSKLLDLSQKSFEERGLRKPSPSQLINNKAFKYNFIDQREFTNNVLKAREARKNNPGLPSLFIRARKR